MRGAPSPRPPPRRCHAVRQLRGRRWCAVLRRRGRRSVGATLCASRVGEDGARCSVAAATAPSVPRCAPAAWEKMVRGAPSPRPPLRRCHAVRQPRGRRWCAVLRRRGHRSVGATLCASRVGEDGARCSVAAATAPSVPRCAPAAWEKMVRGAPSPRPPPRRCRAVRQPRGRRWCAVLRRRGHRSVGGERVSTQLTPPPPSHPETYRWASAA